LTCAHHAVRYDFKIWPQGQWAGHINITDFPVRVFPGTDGTVANFDNPLLCQDEHYCWVRDIDTKLSIRSTRQYSMYELTDSLAIGIPYAYFPLRTQFENSTEPDCSPVVRNGPIRDFGCTPWEPVPTEADAIAAVGDDCDLALADPFGDPLFPENINADCLTQLECSPCNGTEPVSLKTLNIGPTCHMYNVHGRAQHVISLEIDVTDGAGQTSSLTLTTGRRTGPVVDARDQKLRAVLTTVSNEFDDWHRRELTAGHVVVCGQPPVYQAREVANPWGCDPAAANLLPVPTRRFFEAAGNPNALTQPFWYWVPSTALTDGDRGCAKFAVLPNTFLRSHATLDQLNELCYNNASCLPTQTPCTVSALLNEYSQNNDPDAPRPEQLPPPNIWNSECGGAWVMRYQSPSYHKTFMDQPKLGLFSAVSNVQNQQPTELDLRIEISDLLLGATVDPTATDPNPPDHGRPVYQLALDRASQCNLVQGESGLPVGHCDVSFCLPPEPRNPLVLPAAEVLYDVLLECDPEVGTIPMRYTAIEHLGPLAAKQSFSLLADFGAAGTCAGTPFEFPLVGSQRYEKRTTPHFAGQCNATLFDAISGDVQIGLPHTLDVFVNTDFVKNVSRAFAAAGESKGEWTFDLRSMFSETNTQIAELESTIIAAATVVSVLLIVAIVVPAVLYSQQSEESAAVLVHKKTV
jgi:hypothetical protein